MMINVQRRADRWGEKDKSVKRERERERFIYLCASGSGK